MPLDFNEYLNFKKVKAKRGNSHIISSYFEEFLNTGGIPEYVLSGNIEYLKELVDDIIYKDIAAFHNIKDPQLLKDFFMLLMERAGKSVSINKLAKILDVSPDTTKRYLGMFADTYLIHLVSRHGKTNERLLSPKKIYSADLGIRTLFTGFRDNGSLFENYVYLKIKGQNPEYIYENGTELDFYTDKGVLIEVKYQSELTKKQKTLFEGFNASKKIIINDYKDLEDINDI